MSRRLDRRLLVIPLAVAVTAAGGYLVKSWSETDLLEITPRAAVTDAGHALLGDDAARRAHERFQQGVAMLQAGQFEYRAFLQALYDRADIVIGEDVLAQEDLF